MTSVFENPQSAELKGEAHSEKEAELFDFKQRRMEIEEQLEATRNDVQDKNYLNELRSKIDQLSDGIAKLEKDIEQEKQPPGLLDDHLPERGPHGEFEIKH